MGQSFQPASTAKRGQWDGPRSAPLV